MEINDRNLEALATYLRKTLSPNGDERAEGKINIFQFKIEFHFPL
jgi:hypothetical protein